MSMLTEVRRAALCRRERGWRFTLLAGVAFTAVQCWGHFHHEMWRDELHCWGVGRAGTGLWDILTGDRRYDGHPFLWYYLLHLVSRVVGSWVALHVVGVVLAVTGALLWLRYAPLPRYLRVLLLPSYYLVYEYGVVSRSYTLGIVITFAFCALYHPQRIRYRTLACLLGLLAATSLYGTLVSVSLALFLFTRGFRVLDPDATDDRARIVLSLNWLAGIALFGAGLLLTAVTTWPPSDAQYAPKAGAAISAAALADDLGRYWIAMLPFHTPVSWSWLATDYLGSQWASVGNRLAWLGGTLLAAYLVALRRAPWLAFSYVLGIVLMTVAQHAIYPGGLRHLGHYFVLLLACVWLYARETRGREPTSLLYALLAVNIGVQVLTGFAALRVERHLAFSGTLAAVRFMREQHREYQPVIASPDAQTSPLAIMLDRPFFFPSSRQLSEVAVERKRLTSANWSGLVAEAARQARVLSTPVLIIVSVTVPIESTPGIVPKLLYRGGPTIISDESFLIYEVQVPKPLLRPK